MNHDRMTSELLVISLSAAAVGSLCTLLVADTLTSNVPGGVPVIAVALFAIALVLGRRLVTVSHAFRNALRAKEQSEEHIRVLAAKPEKQGRLSTARGDQPIQRRECIPVLLVDDHVMVRQGLRSVMEGYPDIEVIGEASNGHEALKLVEKRRPAVVLMDINMPQLNGIEATAKIKVEHPDVAVIGLSMNVEAANQEAMRRAGASVLLAKEAVVTELYHAILAVVRSTQRARPFSPQTGFSSKAV